MSAIDEFERELRELIDMAVKRAADPIDLYDALHHAAFRLANTYGQANADEQAERDQAIAQFEATAAAQGWQRTDERGGK